MFVKIGDATLDRSNPDAVAVVLAYTVTITADDINAYARAANVETNMVPTMIGACIDGAVAAIISKGKVGQHTDALAASGSIEVGRPASL